MSKRHKNKKVNADVSGVEVLENLKEETEMTEKKGFLKGAKEFIGGLPKPVKVVGGVILGASAIAGTAVAAYSKLKSDKEESYIDCDDASYEEETITEASTEADAEE